MCVHAHIVTSAHMEAKRDSVFCDANKSHTMNTMAMPARDQAVASLLIIIQNSRVFLAFLLFLNYLPLSTLSLLKYSRSLDPLKTISKLLLLFLIINAKSLLVYYMLDNKLKIQ